MATYIVNHGTNADFKSFDSSFFGQNTDDNATDYGYAQTAHIGFWFNVGGEFNCYRKNMACEITLNNPLELPSLECLAEWCNAQEKSGEELREELIEQGYDGIILDDEEFGGTSYVVFDANNITIL